MANSPPACSRSTKLGKNAPLTGIDLLAGIRMLLLDGDLAAAEPETLRYRLLHVAAGIIRTAGKAGCASPNTGPGQPTLVTAFNRLTALTGPAG